LCAVIDRAYRLECIDTAAFEFAGNILIREDNRLSDSVKPRANRCAPHCPPASCEWARAPARHCQGSARDSTRPVESVCRSPPQGTVSAREKREENGKRQGVVINAASSPHRRKRLQVVSTREARNRSPMFFLSSYLREKLKTSRPVGFRYMWNPTSSRCGNAHPILAI